MNPLVPVKVHWLVASRGCEYSGLTKHYNRGFTKLHSSTRYLVSLHELDHKHGHYNGERNAFL